jgi:hypothetical protein
MAQVVSRRSLIADAPVGTWLCPSDVGGGRSGPGTGFCSSTSVFPGGETPPMPHTHLHLHIALNPLNPELNHICYLLALLGAHHFLHVSRIRVKFLTLR